MHFDVEQELHEFEVSVTTPVELRKLFDRLLTRFKNDPDLSPEARAEAIQQLKQKYRQKTVQVHDSIHERQ